MHQPPENCICYQQNTDKLPISGKILITFQGPRISTSNHSFQTLVLDQNGIHCLARISHRISPQILMKNLKLRRGADQSLIHSPTRKIQAAIKTWELGKEGVGEEMGQEMICPIMTAQFLMHHLERHFHPTPVVFQDNSPEVSTRMPQQLKADHFVVLHQKMIGDNPCHHHFQIRVVEIFNQIAGGLSKEAVWMIWKVVIILDTRTIY